MTTDRARLTRRAALRALTTGAAVAAFPALLGCAPSPAKGGQSRPEPKGGSTHAAAGSVIMVIRHGEKPDKSGSPPGIDLNGKPDTHSLTVRGWNRAAFLPELFSAGTSPRPGELPKPSAIYAAGVSDEGEGARTRQTVGPLAAKLGVPVDTRFGKGGEANLVAQATSRPGPTLICWQHGEIPAIAAALGAVSPAPPKTWPDERYDMVWIFASTGAGWKFSQLPQMLLMGDNQQAFA